MIVVGIITAPRPRPTLADTLVSYRKAGFVNRTFVFADASAPNINQTCVDKIIVNNPALGNLRNWMLALRTLVRDTSERWLMICEDDIIWADGSHAALLQDLHSLEHSAGFATVGAMSLYFPIHDSRDVEQQNGGKLADGWHRGPRKGMKIWGAQCLVFSRAQAVALLTDNQIATFLSDPKRTKNVDAIVAKSIHDRERDILYRVPCLVDHVGEDNSSLGYKPDRPSLRTRYFTGRP